MKVIRAMRPYTICLILAAAHFLSAAIAAPADTKPVKRPIVCCYYFDGWADESPGNFHLRQPADIDLMDHFPDREPTTGWFDDSLPIVQQQTAMAASAGITAFIFDWYDTTRTTNESDKTLNSALGLFRSLPDKHGMKYCLLYVNNGSYNIPQDAWAAQCQAWVQGPFKDPDYLKIDGKPALVVYSIKDIIKEWGADNIAQPCNILRAAAAAAGFPGVYIIASCRPPSAPASQDPGQPTYYGFDAFTGYNYPRVNGTNVTGENPYSVLVNGSIGFWNGFANTDRVPYIPVVTAGWDPRPWKKGAFWYDRTPSEFADFVTQAMQWSLAHPITPNLSGTPVIVVEAWNELGEGSYIMPTRGDGDAYARALRNAVDGHSTP